MKIAIILLLLSVNLLGQDLGQVLKGQKVDKKEVLMMIDQMQASGKITKKQADETKKQLSAMDDAQMDALNDKAIKFIEKTEGNPSAANPDLDKAMKALEKAEKLLESSK